MKRLSLLYLVALTLGCGARTGLRVPDLTPRSGQTLPPPAPCCQEVRNIRVHLIPDPIVPAPERVARVDWVFRHRCSTDRALLNCFVTQYVRGGTDSSGDCVGTGLDPAPPTFHVGTATNRPDDIGFEFVGAIQGRVCVSGTVHFTNGQRLEIPARWWNVRYCGGGRIPEIVWWLRRPDGATVTSVVPGSASGEGCPAP